MSRTSQSFTLPFPCCPPRPATYNRDLARFKYSMRKGDTAARTCPQCGTKHTWRVEGYGISTLKLVESTPKAYSNMKVIRVHDDGRREQLAGYDNIGLDAGRKLMREIADDIIKKRERVEQRGDQRVLTIEYSLDDVVILQVEEEWPTT